MPDNEIENSIGAHVKILEKMDRKNKKKIEAASNEDFELAAKYRNQYNQLKNKLMTYEDAQKLF
jgi:protein-arginine kinase activator protein McsA